jgi:hypothetical protein
MRKNAEAELNTGQWSSKQTYIGVVYMFVQRPCRSTATGFAVVFVSTAALEIRHDRISDAKALNLYMRPCFESCTKSTRA